MHTVLEALQREMAETLEGLTAAKTQLRTADDPARWSIQQIVEHLSLTYALSVEAFAQRMARGTPTKARPTLVQRVGQVVVLRMERFPQRRQAPEKVRPQRDQAPLTGRELGDRVREDLGRFDSLATRAGRSLEIAEPSATRCSAR